MLCLTSPVNKGIIILLGVLLHNWLCRWRSNQPLLPRSSWRDKTHRIASWIKFHMFMLLTLTEQKVTYRSWYGISVCICKFVVYWVVIMVPILFCFSSSTILFLLLSEMVLLITDPGDHNNSYPGCFPLSAILFPSTTEMLPPCVGQTERWRQIETCWYTRLGWRYYIDKQVGHPAKYANRWKRDQSSSVHGNSKVSSSSLASQIRPRECDAHGDLLFSSQLFSFEGNSISFDI